MPSVGDTGLLLPGTMLVGASVVKAVVGLLVPVKRNNYTYGLLLVVAIPLHAVLTLNEGSLLYGALGCKVNFSPTPIAAVRRWRHGKISHGLVNETNI